MEVNFTSLRRVEGDFGITVRTNIDSPEFDVALRNVLSLATNWDNIVAPGATTLNVWGYTNRGSFGFNLPGLTAIGGVDGIFDANSVFVGRAVTPVSTPNQENIYIRVGGSSATLARTIFHEIIHGNALVDEAADRNFNTLREALPVVRSASIADQATIRGLVEHVVISEVLDRAAQNHPSIFDLRGSIRSAEYLMALDAAVSYLEEHGTLGENWIEHADQMGLPHAESGGLFEPGSMLSIDGRVAAFADSNGQLLETLEGSYYTPNMIDNYGVATGNGFGGMTFSGHIRAFGDFIGLDGEFGIQGTFARDGEGLDGQGGAGIGNGDPGSSAPNTSPRPTSRPDDLMEQHGFTGSSPVVIDLDRDGVEVDAASTVAFDFDGDTFRELGAWVGTDDGLLVVDLAANGGQGTGDNAINQLQEVILSGLTPANDSDTDLQALGGSWLNSDRTAVTISLADGSTRQIQVLNAADAGWGQVHIWRDLDQDGEIDGAIGSGEVRSLASFGITEIRLGYEDGSAFSDYSEDITTGLATLHGLASYVRNGQVVAGAVGDFTFWHQSFGWSRTAVVVGNQLMGYEYTFETGGILRVVDVAELTSNNFDLAAHSFDIAKGDADANLLTAQNHSRAVQITGSLGNDTIRGGNADDLLGGGVGVDQLSGFDGNDVLAIDAADLGAGGFVNGGQGIDIAMVEGADGVNLLLINRALEAAVGGTGADTIRAADTVAGVVNNDDVRISGRDGNDILSGDNGDDALTGDNGTDQLGGGWGDDFLDGGRHFDTLWGGDGDDQLYGGDGSDLLVGGDHDDRLYGGTLDDTIQGGDGDDVLEGSWGNDSLHAGYGDDTVDGGAGDDAIGFWRGDAELWGRAGNDRFVLSSTDTQIHRGWSVIFGGIGNDTFVLHGSLSSWDVRVVDGDQWQLHRGSGSDRIVVDLVDIEIVEIDGAGYWRQDFADAVDALPGRDRPVIENASEDRDRSDDYVRANFTNGTGDDNTTANGSFTTVYGGTFLGWTGNDVLRGSTTFGGREDGQPEWAENGAYVAMDGGSGSDVLYGNATDETLIGNTGQDQIFGGAEDDTIIGGAGSDQVAGGTGNDSLIGESGSDVLNGDSGNDRAFGDSGNDVIVGGAGADALDGGSGSDQLAGGDDDDTLDGETGFDRLYGDAGADSLIGGAGSDYLYGGAGNDTLRGGAAPGSTVVTNGGVNYLAGGDGNDLLTGATLDDQLAGQAGNDTLLGGSGRDVLLGGTGADSLDGGAGLRDMASYEDANLAINVNLASATVSGGDAVGDTIVGLEQAAGGSGNDTLTGKDGNPDGSGDNLLIGNGGNDRIDGLTGDDDLFGNDGADTIWGRHGVDRLYGGEGDDSLVGGDLDDTVFGNEGNDIIDGDEGADLVNGLEGNDTVRGGTANDTVYGGTGNDLLNGNGFDDILNGHSGNDSLYGETGMDRIVGGTGTDMLFGGAGDGVRDVFIFETAADSGTGASVRDTIEGFALGIDRIDVSEIDSHWGLPAHVFSWGNQTAQANSVWFFRLNNNQDTVIRADTDGMVSTIEFEILLRGFSSNLTSSDFML